MIPPALLALVLLSAWPAAAEMLGPDYKPCGDQPNTVGDGRGCGGQDQTVGQRLSAAYKALAQRTDAG
jgi:hypothetical protein